MLNVEAHGHHPADLVTVATAVIMAHMVDTEVMVEAMEETTTLVS